MGLAITTVRTASSRTIPYLSNLANSSIFSPLLKRTGLSDPAVSGRVAEELRRVENVVKIIMNSLWMYKWRVILAGIGLMFLIMYLMGQALVLFVIFYNMLLTIPVEQQFTLPLHFKYPPPYQNGTPCANFLLTPERITTGQGYEMQITLVLPESTVNMDVVGMFDVSLQLYYEKVPGSIPTTSERYATLRWKTGLLRTMYTVVYAVPLLLGFKAFEEKQTVELQMYDEYIYNPPRSGEPLSVSACLSDSRVQIYSSTLHVHAKLYGFSYYGYHYFYTSMSIGTTFIFMFELFVTFWIIVAILIRYSWMMSVGSTTFSQAANNNVDFPRYQERRYDNADDFSDEDPGEEFERTGVDPK